MDLHEVLDAVEHIMIARGRRVHLLEDRRYVAEDCSVQKRCMQTTHTHTHTHTHVIILQ